MPVLDLFGSMLWFLVIIWIWLVIAVFIDIFRSDDLSGRFPPRNGAPSRRAVPSGSANDARSVGLIRQSG